MNRPSAYFAGTEGHAQIQVVRDVVFGDARASVSFVRSCGKLALTIKACNRNEAHNEEETSSRECIGSGRDSKSRAVGAATRSVVPEVRLTSGGCISLRTSKAVVYY